MAKLPLEGIRVIDLAVVWALPWGAMQLADMGAEVIRVESLQYNFVAQRGIAYPSQTYLNQTGGWNWANRGRNLKRAFNAFGTGNYYGRNKLSMTVDLSRPEGRDILLRLVKVSDAVIENQAARNMENLNLDYDVLSQANPDIIMIRMPGFGISGPYWHRLGYGYTMDAIAGHTHLRKYPDADPITSSVYHGDACAGAMAAMTLLMALHYRNRSGKGQLIDISQTENAQCTYSGPFLDYFWNGRVQDSVGNRDPNMAPQNVYHCKPPENSRGGEDIWWTISVENDEQWRALCQVMGQPELADDPRFADVTSRKRNEEMLDPVIEAWAADKDQYQIMHLLQAEGIPAGPVIDYPDVEYDPHVQARGYMVPMEHPEIGTHLYPGPLYKLSETPCRMGPPPCLGEHNEYVYKELLGYSDDEYQHLIEEKHIGWDYLPDAR